MNRLGAQRCGRREDRAATVPAVERSWERWDDAGVADEIERYWAESAHEAVHRQSLADLCALYLPAPTTTLLEVGCGSGRVYERLVPQLIAQESYTGVDTSQAMLAHARRRHPDGRFLHGDAYRLGFGDGAFDVVVCFEVLRHLPEVGPVIRELVQASRTSAIFTVWPAAAGVVEQSEQVRGSSFLHRCHSHAYLYEQVRQWLPGRALEMEVAVLHDECWAYVLHGRDTAGELAFTRLFPVTGYARRMRELLARPAAQG